MATENVKVLKIDTNPAQTSVKELRTQLKELKDTMLSCEQGTEEYNKALKQAAEIQHTLKEQMEEVNATAMDFGQITSNCVGALGGMVAGFQAATAVMNLFGTENEDVIRTLKTMQQLMSITQALPAIDKGVKAFKRLGIAIKASSTALKGFSAAAISTGIGALVVLLGLLIANFDKLKSSIGGVNEEEEKQKDIAIEKHLESVNKQLKSRIDLESKLVRIRGGNDVDVARAVVKAYEQEISAAEKETEALKRQIEVIEERQRRGASETSGSDAAELLNLNIQLNKRNAEIEDYKVKLEEANEELKNQLIIQKAIDDIEKKKYEKQLAIELDSAKSILGAEKSLQQQLDDKFAGQPLKVPVDFEFEKEDEAEIPAAWDELRKRVEDFAQQVRDSLKTPQETYDEELQLLNTSLNAKKISYEEYYKYLEQLEQHKLETTEEYFVTYAQIASQALGDIGGLFNALADLQDANTKKGFEQQKKYQIAAATMDMLGGVVSSWTSAMNPSNAWMTIYGQIAMGLASSIMVLTTGLLQIQKIKNTQMNGNGGGASPSAGAIGTIIAPVQYTSDVQGASIEGAIKDTKVYVVESDITDTQNKVSVTENEARF